jgi:hypothetical protein
MYITFYQEIYMKVPTLLKISFYRLQCKIKDKVNPAVYQNYEIPMVDDFHLMDSSKLYHVYRNPTIRLLDMKYCRYTMNSLRTDDTFRTFSFFKKNFRPPSYEEFIEINFRFYIVSILHHNCVFKIVWKSRSVVWLICRPGLVHLVLFNYLTWIYVSKPIFLIWWIFGIVNWYPLLIQTWYTGSSY